MADFFSLANPPVISAPAPSGYERNRAGLLIPKEAGTIVVPYRDPPDVVVGSVGTPYESTTDTTSYTATGLPSVGASQRAIIGVILRGNGTATVNAITLNGNAVTHLHTVQVSNLTLAWYLGGVGHSGNVAVTSSLSLLRFACALWPCSNILNTSASDSGGTAGTGITPINDSLTIAKGGAAFGIGYLNNTTGASDRFTWTGLTESFDRTLESPSFWSGSASAFAAAQASLSVSMNNVNSTSGISGAAWVSIR